MSNATRQRLEAEPVPPARVLHGLEQRVLARYRQLRQPVDETLVVGFSGGVDSLALAAMLGRIATIADIKPVLCHVDHRLRADSGVEQTQAEALAEAVGLPFFAARAEDDPRRLHPGVGMEEAARRERFRLLADVAGSEQPFLVLAHHRQDQAETVLLHLLRGAGPAGVAGMAELRDLRVPWWGDLTSAKPVKVWRPLLTESREAVRAYAAALGLDPVVDPSNEEDGLRRNAIRRTALPLLERIVPGASEALTRYAALAADEDRLLDELADAVWRRVVGRDGVLDHRALSAQPVALRRRVVRRWLAEAEGLDGVARERVEAVLRQIERPRGNAAIELAAGLSVVSARDGLRVARSSAALGEGRIG